MANSRDLTLAMRLLLDARRFVQGLTQANTERSKFTQKSRSEFAQLGESLRKTQNRLGAIGLSFGAGAIGIQSARLDKSLEQIGLTAGVSRENVSGLRRELFTLAKDTGQQVEDLQQGFGNLVAGGTDWRSSLEVIRATNKAMAVTGAQADALTSALGVTSTAFNFDLSRPRLAVELLDKMTVAGRQGNAELENLSTIFPRVGTAGVRAGLSFERTLALAEGLSLLERQPERLGTLAESTLRLFTNDTYRKSAARATGVSFYDGGERRDPLKVLADMQRKYAAMQTDQQRDRYIARAFGKTDLDTQRGLNQLLSGNTLMKVEQFAREIENAGGTLDRDLNRALSNADDQARRLKNTLRDAADDFARPFKWATEKGVKLLLDEEGGLGLGGWGLAGTGAALLAGGYAAKRFGGPMLNRIVGGAGSLGAGVATGKALEAAAGITPVYVTNWPGGGGIGDAGAAAVGAMLGGRAAGAARVFGGWRAGAAIIAGTPLKNIATLGVGGVAGAAAGVAGAGLAGYGIGSAIYSAIDETAFADKLGSAIAHALAFLGNDNARQAIKARDEFEGRLKIEIDDKRTRVTELKRERGEIDLDVAFMNGLQFSPL